MNTDLIYALPRSPLQNKFKRDEVNVIVNAR